MSHFFECNISNLTNLERTYIYIYINLKHNYKNKQHISYNLL